MGKKRKQSVDEFLAFAWIDNNSYGEEYDNPREELVRNYRKIYEKNLKFKKSIKVWNVFCELWTNLENIFELLTYGIVFLTGFGVIVVAGLYGRLEVLLFSSLGASASVVSHLIKKYYKNLVIKDKIKKDKLESFVKNGNDKMQVLKNEYLKLNAAARKANRLSGSGKKNTVVKNNFNGNNVNLETNLVDSKEARRGK